MLVLIAEFSVVLVFVSFRIFSNKITNKMYHKDKVLQWGDLSKTEVPVKIIQLSVSKVLSDKHENILHWFYFNLAHLLSCSSFSLYFQVKSYLDFSLSGRQCFAHLSFSWLLIVFLIAQKFVLKIMRSLKRKLIHLKTDVFSVVTSKEDIELWKAAFKWLNMMSLKRANPFPK